MMRLQLTIQRHALPPTNLLWTVRAEDPTSTSAHASATITQLLEDVNDIIQLESEDWGLEDYVVEVGGYECLHFQPIASVLKEDDKVIIRALQTSDLRIRKIGGRHQISVEGRHLFDGVAFGRPYLRKTARPAFRIPPRKRRKLDLGHGQYIEDDSMVQPLLTGSESITGPNMDHSQAEAGQNARDNAHLQLVDKQYFEDADQDSTGDEDDCDFESDFESFEEDEEDEEGMELSEELKALLQDDPLDLGTEEYEDNDQSLNSEPEVTVSPARRKYRKSKRDTRQVLLDGGLASTNPPSAIVQESRSSQPKPDATLIYSSDLHKGNITNAKVERRRSFNDSDRFNGNPNPSAISSSGVTSSESEEPRDSSDTSSSLSESISSSSESDSESKSESGSDSDSESESDSKASSVSHSGSKSNSEAKSAGEEQTISASIQGVRITNDQAAKAKASTSARSVPKQSAPFEGSSRTHRNNQRNKKRMKLNALKAAGLLGPQASFKELYAFQQAQAEAPMKVNSKPQADEDEVFEARKHELLKQLVPSEAGPNSMPNRPDETLGGTLNAFEGQISAVPAQPLAAANAESREKTPNKRVKLDVESSRRMVFGSLGLKTPKTPAAEQQLRTKLAQQGRPSNDRPVERAIIIESGKTAENADTNVSQPTDPEAWKEQLSLSAVECEVDGKVLSTPPFPFVQRWEQNKQKNHLQDQSDEYNSFSAGGPQHVGKEGGELGKCDAEADTDSVVDGVRLNGAIQNQLIQETEELSKRQEINIPSTPNLPLVTDFNTLKTLKVEDAVVGAMIAFKQLDMSKETNWQPEISAYRTARIEEILEDGTLKILLAERDRTIMQPPLGEQTGERVFDKFEMPIDEEEGPDTGFREVTYTDLIEPKLLVGGSSDLPRADSRQASHESESGSQAAKEVSQVKDSANSTHHSVQQPSAQVDVSTPRRKEISKLIKDAGFHSSLDSELLQPTPRATDINSEDNLRNSRDPSDKQPSSRAMNLDGAVDLADPSRLNSPLFADWDASSVRLDNDDHDISNGFEPTRSSSVKDSLEARHSAVKDVTYPKLSQLVLDERSTPTTDKSSQSTKARTANPIANNEPYHGSDASNKENDGMSDAEESQFDSLKSTIPPSEDAAPRSDPPSPDGSQITNPVYELDGKSLEQDDFSCDDSSDTDLPSLSEFTSTARSSKVSPPQLKRASIEKRKSTSPVSPTSVESSPPLRGAGGRKQKKSISPTSSTSLDEKRSTNNHTQTATSSSFQPSQIPTGTQLVDLTLSSDAISADHSDEEYVSTQRSSVRIKQSSSQTSKARETLSDGMKIGNRRLVRGKLGRAKPSY